MHMYFVGLAIGLLIVAPIITVIIAAGLHFRKQDATRQAKRHHVAEGFGSPVAKVAKAG